MAQRTNPQKTGSIAVILVVFAVAIAIALDYYHFPGGAALWAALLIVAAIEPAPTISSASSKSAMPMTDAEASRMRDYQGIKKMLTSLVWPQELLAKGVTLAFSMVLALAIGIGFLPLREIVVDHKLIPMLIEHVANGLLGALAIYALYAWISVKRRDPPLVTIQQTVEFLVAKDIIVGIIAIGVGAGIGVVAGSAYAGWLHASGLASIGVELATAVIAVAAIASMAVRKQAQQKWRDTLEAIDYWSPIWPSLKLSSLPTIVERAIKTESGVTVDRGSIHFASGPQAIMSNVPIMAAIPTDVRLFRLYELESVGVSNSLFRLVLWPTSAQPDIGSPDVDADLVNLWINGVVQETLRSSKVEAAIFMEPELLTGTESPRTVYRLNVSILTSGVSMLKLYEIRKAIEASVGSPIIVDLGGESIFCGDFDNAVYDNPQHQQLVNGVAALEAWTARLEAIKFAQPPVMLSHLEIADGVSIDTGSIPFTVGPAAVLSNAVLLSSVPTGAMLFRLYAPDESNPSVISPTLFRFLTWANDATPDINDPDCPVEIVQLWLEGNIVEVARSNGLESALSVEVDPIHASNSSSAAYLVKITWLSGFIGFETLQLYAEEIAGRIGTGFVVAPDQGAVFCGDFDNVIYDDPDSEGFIETIVVEQQWAERWTTLLGNPNNPIAYADRTENYRIQLVDGLHCGLAMVPFATRLTITPSTYFNVGIENQMVTMLKPSKMAAILPFLAPDRATGLLERHARLFKVVYSTNDSLPNNPAKMMPDDDNSYGVWYIVWWKINRVISTLNIEIPDVYEVHTVNTPKPRQPNLWSFKIRFYGKLKFSDIVNAQTKFQQEFQCDWLRVRATRLGAEMFVGPSREEMSNYYDQQVLDLVDDLDWEHAWRIAKITGPDLSVPIKVSSAHPPYNDRVTEYVFRLPQGFTPGKVKALLDTLKTAVGLSFLQIDEVPDSSNEIMIIASRAAPLPAVVPMDFKAVDELDGQIPVGVSITGEVVNFDRKSTPHLLVVGSTGTGKAQPLDEELPVPISPRFPNGIAHIGELEVGDMVFGVRGDIVPIIGLSDITDERVYRLYLDSGETVRCSGEHLWLVLRNRPKDRSPSSMVKASGLMNIASPVRTSGSGELAAQYRHEIEMLTKSSTGSEPYMRAVLTTKEIVNLINDQQSVQILSGSPTPGELASFLGMPASEVAQTIIAAEKADDWMIQSAAPILNELAIEPRVALTKHLLDYLTVEVKERWRTVAPQPERFTYRVLRGLLNSLGVPIQELEDGHLLVSSMIYTKHTLKTRTITRVDVTDEVVPMRCLSVQSREHCYLTKGYVPTHNSVLTRTLVYGSLIRGDEVYIIDPVKQAVDLSAFKPYTHGFTTSNSRLEALGYLTAIYEEVKRRQEINAKYGAENGLSLAIPPEDRYPYILVEIDEFAQLMYPQSVAKNAFSRDPSQNKALIEAETENSVISSIGRMVGAIAAIARSTLVTLILATQRMDHTFLDAIPQGGNLKTNLGRILLGNASLGERASALRNPDTTPRLPADSPQGRAVYEPSIGRGLILQSWYSSPEDIQAALAERLEPLPDAMKLDPYASLPSEMVAMIDGSQDGEPVAIYVEQEAQINDDLFQEMLSQVVSEPGPAIIIEADQPEPAMDEVDQLEPTVDEADQPETTVDEVDPTEPTVGETDQPEPTDTSQLDPWELYDLEHSTVIEDSGSSDILENDQDITSSKRTTRKRGDRRIFSIDVDTALSTFDDVSDD
jgi:hypothetical protein